MNISSFLLATLQLKFMSWRNFRWVRKTVNHYFTQNIYFILLFNISILFIEVPNEDASNYYPSTGEIFPGASKVSDARLLRAKDSLHDIVRERSYWLRSEKELYNNLQEELHRRGRILFSGADDDDWDKDTYVDRVITAGTEDLPVAVAVRESPRKKKRTFYDY